MACADVCPVDGPVEEMGAPWLWSARGGFRGGLRGLRGLWGLAGAAVWGRTVSGPVMWPAGG